MRKRALANFNLFNKSVILILLILMVSCNVYENTFVDNYNDEVKYKDELNCSMFRYGLHYKHYAPRKCFKTKFSFKDREFDNLISLYKEVSNLDKKGLRNNPIYNVSEVSNNSKHLLVNHHYGLYRVTGVKFAPNFYFIRTEKDIYFYDCKDKITLLEKLNESKSIDKKLKNEITSFIEERCNSKDGLKWYSGARFY